ncbi:MAG: hypothetical protein M1840_006730 [Geoglossum simile]|nr:MAG: hypothetical protein M1840_006730 [Geoglossum simile]
MECGEDNTVHEREDKELQITEEVDFSSARIGERPSNFPLVSKLTTVKGIRRVFALVMPDQEPYYFAINIVRDRQEYNRGWVQLRAASPGERRGTQLSRLAIDMSIGEVASAQIHCVPETEYEGGVFLLPMQIDIPKGERYLVSCTLKMEFPVEATIYELNVGDVPVCIAETISLNSEKQHPLPNLSEVDDEDSQEDLHIDDAHFSRSTWSKFLGFLRELFRLHRDRKDEVAWWPVVYDMEASHNLMTLRVQKDIGSKLKPAQPTVLFVSGIKIQVLGSTTAGWRRMGRKRRYKGKFYVVDTAEFDVTVGKEFIQKNGLPEPLGSVGAE